MTLSTKIVWILALGAFYNDVTAELCPTGCRCYMNEAQELGAHCQSASAYALYLIPADVKRL